MGSRLDAEKTPPGPAQIGEEREGCSARVTSLIKALKETVTHSFCAETLAGVGEAHEHNWPAHSSH